MADSVEPRGVTVARTCTTCEGTGITTRKVAGKTTQEQESQTCSVCHGSGEVT